MIVIRQDHTAAAGSSELKSNPAAAAASWAMRLLASESISRRATNTDSGGDDTPLNVSRVSRSPPAHYIMLN